MCSRRNVWSRRAAGCILFGVTGLLVACGGGGGGDASSATSSSGTASTPAVSMTTVSGQAVDDPVVGATVTVKDLSGATLGTAQTDAAGRFSVSIQTSLLQNGYLVSSTGGSVNGVAFAGTLRAVYAGSESPTAANVTLLTSLVSVLGDREPSGTALARREAVLTRLVNAGLFARDQWNAVAPTNVATGQLQSDVLANGLDATLSSTADLLSVTALASPAVQLFGYFPAAFGGVVGIQYQTTTGPAAFDVIAGQSLRSGNAQVTSTALATGTTFQVIGAPPGLSVDATTGALSYLVPAAASAQQTFTIRVSTAAGRRDFQLVVNPLTPHIAATTVATGDQQIVSDATGSAVISVPAGAATPGTRMSIVRTTDSKGQLQTSFIADRPLQGNLSIEMSLQDYSLGTTGIAASVGMPSAQVMDAAGDGLCQSSGTTPNITPKSWFSESHKAYWATIGGTVGRLPGDLGSKVATDALTLGDKQPQLTWTKTTDFVLCGPDVQFDSSGIRRTLTGEPVLFVHGYTDGNGLSDGEFGAVPLSDTDISGVGLNDTFGAFLDAIRQYSPPSGRRFVPFLFRWKTNQRFEDAAAELRLAVDQIKSQTGRSVHIVAHSFGGVLVRTYLQGLAERADSTGYARPVLSVTSFGSPYLGLLHAASPPLPRGYDEQWQFNLFCKQISCHEMGDVVGAYSSTAKVFGVQQDPSAKPLSLMLIDTAGNPFPDRRIDYQVLIGLMVDKGFLAPNRFADGDGLISFQGQRFGTVTLAAGPLLNKAVFGTTVVTERLLGFEGSSLGSSAPLVGSAVPDSAVFPGFVHNLPVADVLVADSSLARRLSAPSAIPEVKLPGSCLKGCLDMRLVDVANNLDLAAVAVDELSPARVQLSLRVDAPLVSGVSIGTSGVGSPLIGSKNFTTGAVPFTATFYPNTKYDFVVSAAGQVSAHVSWTSGPTAPAQVQDLGYVYLPSAAATGNVTLNGAFRNPQNGAPVAGVKWTIVCNGNGIMLKQGMTESTGVYSAAGLPTATCAVSVSGAGVLVGSTNINLPPSGTTTQDLTVGVVVPQIGSVSPAGMVANGQDQDLTINGTGFSSGNAVQFKSGVGAGSGVWTPSSNAINGLTPTQISIRIKPGTVSDTINVRVCRYVDQTGSNDCTNGVAAVTVTAPPTGAPTVALTATPAQLSGAGQSTLTWSSTNATSCTASGGWSGGKGASGTQSVQVATTTSYMLTCSGSGGSASASTTINVNAATFSIGGTVSSLSGNGVRLHLNVFPLDDVLVTASGTFSFPYSVPTGTSYIVSVAAQPSNPSQVCAVTNGSGTVATTNITNVAVACTTTSAVPTVSLSALPTSVSAGGFSTLTWSSTNATSCTASGGWSGSKTLSGVQSVQVAATTTYALTCSGGGGSGSASTTVNVNASAFTVGGTVSGLSGSGLVLTLNGGNAKTINTAGAFTFNTALASGSNYAVAVQTQPTNPVQVCFVSAGSGTGSNVNVTNVQVTCSGSPKNWGSALLIDTGTNPVGKPNIAVDTNGNATAVWFESWSNGTTTVLGLAGNRYVAGVGWGTETKIWTNNVQYVPGGTSLLVDPPKIAASADGSAIALWIQSDSNPNTFNDCYASRYVPGQGWGAPQIVVPNVISTASVAIAMDAQGNAVALCPQSVGNSVSLFASRYISGQGWAAPEQISATSIPSTTGAHVPVVGMDASGNAVAVWVQWDGTLNNLYFNRFTAGQGWGAAQLLQTGTANRDFSESNGNAPRLVVSGSGNGMLVWEQAVSSVTRVYAKVYDSIQGWGTSQVIDPGNTVGGPLWPRIAMDSSGNGIAVWAQSSVNSSAQNIWANRYVAGQGWGSGAAVEQNTTSTNFSSPEIAIDAAGEAVVVWDRKDNIWSNRFDPASGWSAAVSIGGVNVPVLDNPVVGVDGGGNAIAVWSQPGSPAYGIWANRLQ